MEPVFAEIPRLVTRPLKWTVLTFAKAKHPLHNHIRNVGPIGVCIHSFEHFYHLCCLIWDSFQVVTRQSCMNANHLMKLKIEADDDFQGIFINIWVWLKLKIVSCLFVCFIQDCIYGVNVFIICLVWSGICFRQSQANCAWMLVTSQSSRERLMIISKV